MNNLIEAFWFFLPAGIANLSPVIAARMPLLKNWKAPLDMGKSINGQRVLGANKTWRGLLFGALMAALTAGIIYEIRDSNNSLATAMIIGGLMGFGALIGDAVESFFKRRRGVKPGDAWFPFDQTDYIIGGLVIVAPFTDVSLALALAVFFLYFVLHVVTSYFGYLVGLKDKPI